MIDRNRSIAVAARGRFRAARVVEGPAFYMKLADQLKPVHEQRMRLLALGAGVPAVIAALVLLWIADYTPKVQWTVTVLILGIWWACASAIRERVASPLRTLANLL